MGIGEFIWGVEEKWEAKRGRGETKNEAVERER